MRRITANAFKCSAEIDVEDFIYSFKYANGIKQNLNFIKEIFPAIFPSNYLKGKNKRKMQELIPNSGNFRIDVDFKSYIFNIQQVDDQEISRYILRVFKIKNPKAEDV